MSEGNPPAYYAKIVNSTQKSFITSRPKHKPTRFLHFNIFGTFTKILMELQDLVETGFALKYICLNSNHF